MNTKKILSALLMSVVIFSETAGLALAKDKDRDRDRDNERWRYSDNRSGNWNKGNGNANGHWKNGRNSRGTVVDFRSGSDNHRTYITPRKSWANHSQVLSENDQNSIHNRIDGVPMIRRLDYLIQVLTRIETLRGNIEASSRTPEKKARLIAILDGIVELIQNRISDGIGTGTGTTDDNTPPVTSLFNVSGITSTSAMISTTINESGKGYFVILPSGSTAPTAVQVRAGQNASGTTASMKGSSNIVPGINQFSVIELSPSTSYTIYFVAEDSFGNLQTAGVNSTFTTAAAGGGTDTTPPVISALSLTGVTSTEATLKITSNEAGILYGVTLPAGSAAPSVAQVKAWQNASGTLASLRGAFTIASGANEFDLVGFSPSTAYVLYLVAQDTTGNLQASVMNTSFTTLSPADLTPPVSSAFDIIGIGTGSATVSVSMDEPGTIRFVVLSSGSTVPTPAQVKAHQDASGNPVTLHDTFNTANAGFNQFAVTGLSPSTAYILCFIAEDVSGNLQTSVTSKTFSTATPADTTAPVITNISLTGVTNNTAVLELNSNEPGTVYSVTVLSGQTAPSVAQVKAWQDASGSGASLNGTSAIVSGSNDFNLSGFTAATSYTLYFVTADTIGNTEAATHSINFTTAP